MRDADRRQKATEFYVGIQIVGTPDDCLQKIEQLHALTGLDHLIAEFSFGALPHEEAEVNMRLFADRVLSVLQHEAKFARAPVALAAAADAAAESVFAPA